MDGSLPGSTAPFQKPAGMMRCKRLILRRRNWPVLPFQKQVFLGDAGHLVGGRQQVLRAFNRCVDTSEPETIPPVGSNAGSLGLRVG